MVSEILFVDYEPWPDLSPEFKSPVEAWNESTSGLVISNCNY